MTMIAVGTAIQLGGTSTIGGLSQSIDYEYGYGANLNAYRGKLYTNAAVTTTTPFPNTSNPISMSVFYSTRKIPSGSITYTPASTVPFTVPPYNSIVIQVRAGGGGGGGGGGGTDNTGCNQNSAGGAGGAGTQSVFGNAGDAWRLVAAAGGGGGGGSKGNAPYSPGAQGTDGAGYTGSPSRSPGGNAGSGYSPAPGGAGGGAGYQTITLSNPLLSGGGPTSGSSISYSVGGGGSAGPGGGGIKYDAITPCAGDPGRNGGAGTVGADGVITISWS